MDKRTLVGYSFIVVALFSSHALADELDVRGGHFDQNTVSGGFFSDEPESRDVTAPAPPVRKKPDSFGIGTAEEVPERLPEASRAEHLKQAERMRGLANSIKGGEGQLIKRATTAIKRAKSKRPAPEEVRKRRKEKAKARRESEKKEALPNPLQPPEPSSKLDEEEQRDPKKITDVAVTEKKRNISDDDEPFYAQRKQVTKAELKERHAKRRRELGDLGRAKLAKKYEGHKRRPADEKGASRKKKIAREKNITLNKDDKTQIKKMPGGDSLVSHYSNALESQRIRSKEGLAYNASASGRRVLTPKATDESSNFTRAILTDESHRGKFAVLSLVVAAVPDRHFIETIATLMEVKRLKKIAVRDVITIGMQEVYRKDYEDSVKRRTKQPTLEEQKRLLTTPQPAVDPKTRPPVLKALDAANLAPGGIARYRTLKSRYGITKSPAWIVEYGDEVHVFEGSYDPLRFFNNDGLFVAKENNVIETKQGKEQVQKDRNGRKIVRHHPRGGTPYPRPNASNRRAWGQEMLYRFPDSYSDPKPERLNNVPIKGKDGNYYSATVPACREPNVRRIRVRHKSQAGDSLDMVFYDGRDDYQARKAKQSIPKAIPYYDKMKLDRSNDQQQLMLLISPLEVRCLPTRFHITDDDSARYIEYREGAKAWDKVKPRDSMSKAELEKARAAAKKALGQQHSLKKK